MEKYTTCIIRLGSYPDDPRVRKQIEALLENNFKVDLICTRFYKEEPLYVSDRNLRIFRLPFRKSISDSLLKYFFIYSGSICIITILISLLSLLYRYQTIQVHTLPDFLTFTTFLPKMLGIKIVTDFHEPTPELILTKFGYKKSIIYKLAVIIEQLVLKYSDLSFTVTESLKNRFVQRGADQNKLIVIPNVIDDSYFIPATCKPNKEDHDFILLTHGSIEKRYGHELVIHAVNELKLEYPKLKFFICGFGSYEESLRKLTVQLKCEQQVIFWGYLPFDKLLNLLQEADVGIISMPKNPYSELIDTNKLYEYIAMGLPVIHSRLKPVEENFPDNCIKYFEPDNLSSLKSAIIDLYKYPISRTDMVKNADLIYQKIKWSKIKSIFVNSIFKLSKA